MHQTNSFRGAVLAALSTLLGTLGCSGADSSDGAARGDEQEVVAAASVDFLPGMPAKLSGQPSAGKAIAISYSLERLPQCRANVGGNPGWTITGFYAENGGPPRSFEVTRVTSDGKERVARPAKITPVSGGDIALWFQVTNRFGCSEFDSQYGQNFHFDVKGAEPASDALITFNLQGEPSVEGRLIAGGKVRVRYNQDRLPQCRRSQAGYPQWTITGFAQMDGLEERSFDTGRPNGSYRETVDAVIDLPRAGNLSLWFQVTSIGGCMEYDSRGGKNYAFRVEPS